MADNIQRTIVIDADTQDANNNLTTTDRLLQEIVDQNKELNRTIAEGSDRNTAAIKKSTESTKSLANGFKGIALAFKAMGVGIIIGAFNVLKDIFTSNQGVVDALGIAFKSLNIIFNDFVSFINDNTENIKKFFKDAFSIQGLKDFGTAIKENLIERFKSFIDTLGLLAKGVGELFSGNFKKSFNTFKQAAKESVDIYTGVNNTVDKVTEGVSDLVDASKKYLGNVIDQASAMQKLENQAKIAEAQNKRLIEQYDIQAEKLRQTRDNESLTIKDRIKANDDLGTVLNKQSKAMIANADLVVKQAQRELNLNNNLENRIKLIDAQAERTGILAQIEGFRSEQIVNRIALEKELKELNQTAIDGIAKRASIQREFNASQIKDDTDRLAAQKANIEADAAAETARLTAKRNLYKEGTQAYVDANEELLNSQQEFANRLVENEKATAATISSEKNAGYEAIINDEGLSFETRLEALSSQLELINQTEYSSDEARTAALKANSAKRLEITQAELDQKYAMTKAELDLAANAISVLQQLGIKNKGIQRGLIVAESAVGIASIINSTMAANAGALKTPQAIATSGASAVPVITMNNISAGIGIAANLAATAKALSALGGGGSAGSSSLGGGSTAKPPQFNVVGASSENQLAQTIAQQQNVPVQAYVTSTQVSSQQALDRQTINNAVFI